MPMQLYLPCADLWVITTYYNPTGYLARRKNYARFTEPLVESGINLLTVECAFGSEPFELAPSPSVIQVRGRDVMWMKERLLNLAIAHLPDHVAKVAWVDADMLFTNPAWAQETSARLDEWPIVQPFATVVLQAYDQDPMHGHIRPGYAYQQHLPNLLKNRSHGAFGFAWAARRTLVQQHGIYDAAIASSSDVLWVHAGSGRLDSVPVRRITGAAPAERWSFLARVSDRLERLPPPVWFATWYARMMQKRLPALALAQPLRAHYLAWATRWYASIRGRMTFTPGAALHLWHGSETKRRPGPTHHLLRRHAFDPDADLRLNEEGVWEWASDKAALHRELANSFEMRREDDATG